MAKVDEDWLARQIAAAGSPFRDFQRPDAPFEASQPDADEVYTTADINRIAARKPNLLQKAFKWAAGLVPEPQRAGDQLIGEGEASSYATGIPRAAMNMAWSDIPRALLHSGERYAEGIGDAVQGRHTGTGFAGTGVDALAVLAPPQAMASFVPGMNRAIRRGEADPISSYDKLRARIAEWGDADAGPAITKAANPFETFTSLSLARNNIKPAWSSQPVSLENLLKMGRGPAQAANEIGVPADRFRVIKAEGGDKTIAGIAGRAEPLPLTKGIADWLELATGKKPIVEPSHGRWETDYVKIPDRPPGYPYTTVRIPSDAHAGKPRSGVIDTAPPEAHGKFAGNDVNRFNAAGEPFSKADALIDALKWATSSAPDGQWLVPPGAEPRWARYAKEEAPKGPEPPFSTSPDQLKLLAKDPRIAAILADPDKSAAIRKTLESMKGVSDSGIAKVMEAQHGVPITGERWWGDLGTTGRQGRWYPGGGETMGTLERVVAALKELPAGTSKQYLWTKPENLAKVRGIVEEGVTSPANVWRRLQEKHPELAEQTSLQGLRNVMQRNREAIGYPSDGMRMGAGQTQSGRSAGSKLSDPAFADVFWAAWDKHGGRQIDVAKELGVSQGMVSRYKAYLPRSGPQSAEAAAAEAARRQAAQEPLKSQHTPEAARRATGARWGNKRPLPPRVEAMREKRIQGERAAEELAKREGKPFWDETGRAAAQEADRQYVQELLKRRKGRE